ncbi:unnamed protein product, partial [Dovyalis caffra]
RQKAAREELLLNLKMFIFPACLVNVSLPLAFLSCTKEQFRFLLRTQAKELNKGRPQRKLADGWVDKAVKVGLACFVRSARTVLAFKAQVGRLDRVFRQQKNCQQKKKQIREQDSFKGKSFFSPSGVLAEALVGQISRGIRRGLSRIEGEESIAIGLREGQSPAVGRFAGRIGQDVKVTLRECLTSSAAREVALFVLSAVLLFLD